MDFIFDYLLRIDVFILVLVVVILKLSFIFVPQIKASYGVDDYLFAVTQLSQTTMRSELGKMELDKTFEERDVLNTNIVASINEVLTKLPVHEVFRFYAMR